MPGTNSMPARGAGRGRGVAAGDRVVVGDAQHGDAGRGRARDELRRRAAAVGRGGVGVEIDQRADCAGRRARAARRRPLALAQRAVLANQQLEVRALFVGELEEDLLAFGVLEALAVALEELVRAALALDADEQRLLIVDALAQLLGAFGEQAAGRALEEQERRPRFELRIARRSARGSASRACRDAPAPRPRASGTPCGRARSLVSSAARV